MKKIKQRKVKIRIVLTSKDLKDIDIVNEEKGLKCKNS